jgi:hypothetical protein
VIGRSLNHLLVVLFIGICAHAGPCDVNILPASIRESLNTIYSGWRIVTPAVLELSDRETWRENYSKECPGIIKGRFSGISAEYVLNLIKRENGKLIQQIVYFKDDGKTISPLTLFPPTSIKIVTVIRKFAPGKYRSADGTKAMTIKTDTIGISQIDSWTEVYYWDNDKFRRIVTSE